MFMCIIAVIERRKSVDCLMFRRRSGQGSEPKVKQILINRLPNPHDMKQTKEPELRWQCLNCYKVYKGAEGEQKALDCCGSLIQGWWTNYGKWGKQNWYGR